MNAGIPSKEWPVSVSDHASVHGMSPYHLQALLSLQSRRTRPTVIGLGAQGSRGSPVCQHKRCQRSSVSLLQHGVIIPLLYNDLTVMY